MISFSSINKLTLRDIIIGILIFIIISGGGFSSFYLKSLKSESKKLDSIINVNKTKEKFYINESFNDSLKANELEFEIKKLELTNNRLYERIKKRKEIVIIIDNDFITNAGLISDSSNRFYKQNDSIR